MIIIIIIIIIIIMMMMMMIGYTNLKYIIIHINTIKISKILKS